MSHKDKKRKIEIEEVEENDVPVEGKLVLLPACFR